MSHLINASPFSWQIGFEDNRLVPASLLPAAWIDPVVEGAPWGPHPSLLDGTSESMSGAPWEPWAEPGGASSRFGFVGVTRDQWGSPLRGCTVKLFRTSNDVKLDETVSDANTGAFLLNTAYYPDAHYIITVKAGSPSVQGITVNTLIGS